MSRPRFAQQERADLPRAENGTITEVISAESIQVVQALLDLNPQPSAALDRNYTLLSANQAFLSLFQINDLSDIFGRPLETLLPCQNHPETYDHQKNCLRCLLYAQLNTTRRFETTGSSPWVPDTPLSENACQAPPPMYSMESRAIRLEAGELLLLLRFAEQADTTTDDSLERVYYHDLRNTAGGLKGFLDLAAKSASKEKFQEKISLAQETCNKLLLQIEEHHQLTAARRGRFDINTNTIEAQEFLKEIVQLASQQPFAKNVRLVTIPHSIQISHESNRNLLFRVLFNLLKNACEASESGETVTASCFTEEDRVIYEVHNEQVISKQLQPKIFTRFPSSKGRLRGLGTHSVKILTEQFLNGKASFRTNEREGTTFRLSYPANLNCALDSPALPGMPAEVS